MSTTIAPSPVSPTTIDWVAIARGLADEFRVTAPVRDVPGHLPRAEIERLRATGLTTLLIPAKFGGGGGTYREAWTAVLELAKADASLALVLALHYQISSVARAFDYAGEAESFERHIAATKGLLSAHNGGAGEGRISATPQPDGSFILTGRIPWAIGASLGTGILVTAKRTDNEGILFGLLPTDRKGVLFEEPWSGFGLRASDSRGVRYANVVLSASEVVASPKPGPGPGWPPFFGITGSHPWAAVALGSGYGALDAALEFVRNRANVCGGGKPLADNAVVQDVIGQLWTRLQAARAIHDEVADAGWKLWQRRTEVAGAELNRFRVTQVSPLRLFAQQTGLEVASRIFELTGGVTATEARNGFDRYWRDARTVTLFHSPTPVSRGIGEFHLPAPSPAKAAH